jgi:hypothetical protein
MKRKREIEPGLVGMIALAQRGKKAWPWWKAWGLY